MRAADCVERTLSLFEVHAPGRPVRSGGHRGRSGFSHDEMRIGAGARPWQPRHMPQRARLAARLQLLRPSRVCTLPA